MHMLELIPGSDHTTVKKTDKNISALIELHFSDLLDIRKSQKLPDDTSQLRFYRKKTKERNL